MILAVVIVVALIGASMGGYVLISKLLKEKIKPPGVAADEAIQILLDNIIKPDELDYDLIAFMWPELLNPGDTITPHDIPGHAHIMEDNTWFFWVNDFPFIMFSHPTRYVFIDALTGNYTVAIEDWWPQLNGADLWGTPDEFWNKGYWVYSTYVENSPTNLISPGGFALANSRRTSDNDPPDGNWALIIEGDSGGVLDIERSARQWHDLMEKLGFDVTHLEPDLWVAEESWRYPTETNIENIMDIFSKGLKPCNNFSIYITGHGGTDGAVRMMDGFSLTPEKFSEWICKIENGVHISVTVAACYSGKWIDALKKWDKKVEIIYTATDNDSVGYGDEDHGWEKFREAIDSGDAKPDPNPDDVGLEAISGLVEDMKALADNFKRGDISWVKLWQEAIKTAKEKDAVFQNSEFFKKWTESHPDLYSPCSGRGVENPQEWKSDKVRDIIPPKVVSTSPENGQENVPVDTAITVTFSEAMNKTLTQQAFSIYPSIGGEFSWSENTLIFTPSEKLIPETIYGVMISTEAMDRAGNNLEENYIWSFFTQVQKI